MQTTRPRNHIFISGRLVEYWEDPEFPFGWTPEALERYADRGDWVLLFNGLALTSAMPESPYPS